ncbi:MAG: ATP-binding protein [Clostridiales Family XIII bacterium]|jgi:predicted AAA+ superfamily ATPase|nr:ATP-binding protein [Clostridiales Family XIII bacterium]
MIDRTHYLNNLLRFRDKSPIKVITGVRRCGKSTLLDLFEQHLLRDGVPKENIIRVNFEEMKFDKIKTYTELNDYLVSVKPKSGMAYYIIDEIQRVEKWEKAINSIRLDENSDIYLTGSNAAMLSSELATVIAGRYVEIKMYPLSFSEYKIAYAETGKSDTDMFSGYLDDGGFPGLVEYASDQTAKSIYLDGILNTILMKDVVSRGEVRDPSLMEKLLAYLANNSSSPFSSQKIANYLTSAGRKTSAVTIDSYVALLEKAFVIYRVGRYDIKGKGLLKTLGKVYFVDTGLKNLLSARSGFDYGNDLEGLVYFELARRARKVRVGKLGRLEVDFIAESEAGKSYYQVCASVMDSNVRDRELAPLRAIPDDYPKYLITTDRLPNSDFYGIRHVNILDFLSENS